MIRKYKSPGDFWALESLISTISLFIYSENPATQPISKSLLNGNLGEETSILRQITLPNVNIWDTLLPHASYCRGQTQIMRQS